MLVAGPGIDGGKTVDAPVYLQDVMATSLELAGVGKPGQVEFHSLLPLATGETDKAPIPRFTERISAPSACCRTERYKMIIYPTVNKVRLYDMIEDPLETNDLAEAEDKPVELLNRLFARFRKLQEEMEDPVDVSSAFRAFMNG